MPPPNNADPAFREIHVVCGLIQAADGRLLAALRAHGHLAGKWEFPGGKIEPGESPQAAIERELQEELGCVVKARQSMTTVRHPYADIGLVIHLTPIHCELLSGIPEAKEHLELRWVAATELQELDWAAADIPVVAEWLLTTSTDQLGAGKTAI